RAEIDFVFEKQLGRDRLQILIRIAKHQLRHLAFLIFLRQKPAEDPAKINAERISPEIEFQNQPVPDRWFFERDKNIASKPLHPSIVEGAKPVRVGAFGVKSIQQRAINPLRLLLQPLVSSG